MTIVMTVGSTWGTWLVNAVTKSSVSRKVMWKHPLIGVFPVYVILIANRSKNLYKSEASSIVLKPGECPNIYLAIIRLGNHLLKDCFAFRQH